jgi:protein phosphatase 1 regulatory subunit 7
MQGCVALEELYLSHNGITKMEGLSSLVNLRVLDVSSNKLTSVDDIPNLTQYVYSSISFLTNELWFLISLPRLIYYRLEDLWLNDNQIESLEGFAEAVAGSRQKLTTIYLENNPCVWILFSLLVEFSSVSTIS